MMESNENNLNEFELIANVQLSGSLISKNRETIAFQSEIDDPSSGFIFAPQKKEIYNIDELKKAVDVEVVELIPESPETELDLVPRPIYEEALEALADALETIETQSETISTLEGRVSELETEVETLKEEIDNEKLLRVLAEENSETLREENLLISSDVQNSLQRSILEGIQNSSLLAKNEGLTAQVEALKDEVAGLQSEVDSLNSRILAKEAQIEAGAKSGSDITVRVLNKAEEFGTDLVFRARAQEKGAGNWINGPAVELYNFTSEQVTVDIILSGGAFVKGDWINSVSKQTLAPNQKKTITLVEIEDIVDDYVPNAGFGFTGDREYAGTLDFVTTNGNVALSIALQKQRGDKWGG